LLWLEVLLPKRLEEEFASALSLLVGWSLFVVRLSLLLLQVAKAVSDHMLMLSNLGGAGRRRRQGLTLSDESTG
jgi:hypothetical protein